MPSLRELETRFAASLQAAGVDSDPRIAVYRRTIDANYRNALGATYGVVRQLVGAPFFAAAVDAYMSAHPSVCGDLNVLGDRFGEFLSAYPGTDDLPYLADVARLEWAMDEANRAADVSGTAEDVLQALAAAPPDSLALRRFALDPSCRVITSAFPVLAIWQWHQPESNRAESVAFDAGRDFLLIRRDAGRVTVERLPPAEFCWLHALTADGTLASALGAAVAIDPAFDLGRALRIHMRSRVIAGVVAG